MPTKSVPQSFPFTWEHWYYNYYNNAWRYLYGDINSRNTTNYYGSDIEPLNHEVLKPRRTRRVEHTTDSKILIKSTDRWGIQPSEGMPVPSGYPGGSSDYACYCSNVAAAAINKGCFAVPGVWQELPGVQNALNNAIREAFDASLPNLQPAMSLPNFLYELKDLGKMFTSFSTKYSMKKNIEGGILNYNFGIAPFAQDIADIYSAINRVKSHWDHVRSNQGNLVLNEGNASFSMDGNSGSVEDNYALPNQGMLKFPYNYIYRTFGTVKCQTVVKYDVLDTDSGGRSIVPNMLYLKSMMQAFNVCLDPSIVWNALPFSFVLDWFLPVGDCLEKMRKDTFVPGYTVYHTDLHTKVNRVAETDGTCHSTSFPAVPPAEYKILCGQQIYRRTPNVDKSHIPVANPLHKLEIRLPKGKHWFLGMVLGSSIFIK